MDGVCDMTSVVLLEQLKAFTEKIMADMILPVAMQQGDPEQAYRAPEVYLMLFPAHAGVILVLFVPAHSRHSFPRPRGGDPRACTAIVKNDNFSPLTRG